MKASATFFKKFPYLQDILIALDTNKIDWCIGGSGALFLLGNERLPDDVDIYVRDEQHDTVDTIFSIQSFQYTSPLENVRNSNPKGDHNYQITSGLEIQDGDNTYHWKLDDQLLTQSTVVDGLRLLPPEDVLLIKALLQRGKEVGKHDLEDIRKFENIYTLDMTYLANRIQAIGAERRVSFIWPNLF